MNVLIVDKDCSFTKCFESELLRCESIKKVYIYTDLSFLESFKFRVDLAFINLEFIDSNLDFLLSKIKTKNIIGLTSSSKLISKYINFPQIQKIFKFPVDIRDIIRYLNFQYDIVSKFNLRNYNKDNLITALSNIGFNVSHSGTIYLAEGIMISKGDGHIKAESLYKKIAKEYKVNESLVKWSIYNSVNYAYCPKNENRINKFFGIYDGRKPTPKYIIDFFAKNVNLC